MGLAAVGAGPPRWRPRASARAPAPTRSVLSSVAGGPPARPRDYVVARVELLLCRGI